MTSLRRTVKALVDKTALAEPVARVMAVKSVLAWRRAGRPAPPPHLVKQRNLRTQAKRHGLRVFVETGTHHGEMIDAMLPSFDRIYSIELSADLHRTAAAKFAENPTVELICGDSGEELRHLVPRLKEPALFWLDGHYSAGVTARGAKDTPIVEELQHIFSAEHLDHVVIIDDAREFGANPAYPTIPELSELLHSFRTDIDIAVEDDSIRITPSAKRL